MTFSLKEYICWSACSWVNILEGILLMLSVPSGSMPAAFFLIWRISIWRDSLGHTLLNMCDEGQKSTSAMPSLHDLVEVFPRSTICAKLRGRGESFQCLLVSAILQRHVWRQRGWMCTVTRSGSSARALLCSGVRGSWSLWSPLGLSVGGAVVVGCQEELVLGLSMNLGP